MISLTIIIKYPFEWGFEFSHIRLHICKYGAYKVKYAINYPPHKEKKKIIYSKFREVQLFFPQVANAEAATTAVDLAAVDAACKLSTIKMIFLVLFVYLI